MPGGDQLISEKGGKVGRLCWGDTNLLARKVEKLVESAGKLPIFLVKEDIVGYPS